MIDDHELFVTASIGYSTNVDAGMSPNDLLRDADAAMYRAKARGRDCVEAFEAGGSRDRGAGVAHRRRAASRHRARRDRAVLPADRRSRRAAACSATRCWRAGCIPTAACCTPNHFLPLAEETGLLVDLGTRDAARLARAARVVACRRPRLRQLLVVGQRRQPPTARPGVLQARRRAARRDRDRRRLAVAGDHRDVVAGRREGGDGDVARAAQPRSPPVGRRLRHRLLVAHLPQALPGRGDQGRRSFVSGLGIENEDTTIVEAVVKLGQALGLAVVAEGIETPLQLSRLRELGCDKGQGYLFGRPRPAALIESERVEA